MLKFTRELNSGHGRVGSSVGHLDLKDDQDQVEKSVSKLDLHERPDVVSSIMSTSDNCQISSLQYHEGAWCF